MLSITKLFLIVIRAFVTNSEIDPKLKSQFTVDVLEELFGIAKAHDVAQIVSDVLFKNGLLPKNEKITEELQKCQVNALRRYMSIDREQQMIYKLFENNAIVFVPLKGSVVRDYYPDPYMRTSCDIDVLVREEDLEKAVQLLTSAYNYKGNGKVGYHDVSLFSPSGVHLELHYNLLEKRENLDKLLVKVWDYCVDSEKGKYYKLQSPEYFIYHHIAHMVNHFLRGGCGIRPFIDLYFMQKHMNIDPAKLMFLMEQCQVDEFYKAAVQCVAVWFDEAEATEIVDLIESYVLKGGIYGTKENRMDIDQKRQGGRAKYLLSRIFLPYEKLKYKYTFLQKYKILLPFVWLIRIFSFISPKKRKRAQKVLDMQKKISDTTEAATDKMLKQLKI